MKLRLFAIKKPNGLLIKDHYFSHKPAAKQKRDELNKAEPGHVVTFGPDHRRAKPH